VIVLQSARPRRDAPRAQRTAVRIPVAHDVLALGMLFALLIGVPVVLIALYASWMAGELGVGPSWRRRAAQRPAAEDREPEVLNRRSRVG
jgi:hypothetical protein